MSFACTDAPEVKGWNGNFWLKRDRYGISGLDSLISKFYKLQDVKFNNGAHYDRDSDGYQELLANHENRERRAAAKGEDVVDIPLEANHNEVKVEDLLPKYKLFLVSNCRLIRFKDKIGTKLE